MKDKKLTIDKVLINTCDRCPGCNRALIEGINYSGWHSYKNVDGVMVSVPTCDSCIANNSIGGEKEQ